MAWLQLSYVILEGIRLQVLSFLDLDRWNLRHWMPLSSNCEGVAQRLVGDIFVDGIGHQLLELKDAQFWT